jgi:hypothetical protein
MNILTWYFAFYPAKGPFSKAGTLYSTFGHVEAFGYTKDDTWLFFDPQGRRTHIHVTHLHDEVETLMTAKYIDAQSILRIPANDHRVINPLRGPLTCVSQCAALMGWRAYTVAGLHRKLLRNGAELIHGKQTKGRERRGQESTSA